MFAPSQHDVRRFFCEAWRKDRERSALEPMEALAAQWLQEHPEYHAELADVDAALAAQYTGDDGHGNRQSRGALTALSGGHACAP